MRPHHRVHTERQWSLSGRTFHHDGEISLAMGDGWGEHALPLSLYLPSRAKFVVYALAERADTLPLFLLYPYMYSVDHSTSAWQPVPSQNYLQFYVAPSELGGFSILGPGILFWHFGIFTHSRKKTDFMLRFCHRSVFFLNYFLSRFSNFTLYESLAYVMYFTFFILFLAYCTRI